MEKVKKTIRLDVSLVPAVSERVVAYQTENEGRSIEIKLINNGTDYNYTGDGAIYIDKGDGNIIYKALVFEDGKADYTLTDNDVAVVGVKIAEIRLTPNTILDDTVIVASQFEIEVRRSIYSEKAVESTSEGAAILRAAVVAEAAAVQAEEAANAVEAAKEEVSLYKTSAEESAARAEYAAQQAEKVANPQWQLLKEVELTEAVSAYSEKADGLGDTTKGVRVALYLPPNTVLADNSITFTSSLLGSNALAVDITGWVSNGQETFCIFDTMPNNDIWDIKVSAYTKRIRRIFYDISVTNNNRVRYVKFTNSTLPVGTKIKIWGLL